MFSLGNVSWQVTRTMLTFFLSVVLAAIALVGLSFQAPDLSIQMLNVAGSLETWLRDTLLPNAGVSSTVNYWVRWLIDDNQLLFLFFVVIARIILSLFLMLVTASFKATKSAFEPKRFRR